MSRNSAGRIALLVMIASATAAPLVATAEEPVKSVRASDLLKSVQVIGDLGKPLGELTTIRGTWHHVAYKDATTVFRVSHVDGRPVASKIEFRNRGVRPFDFAGGQATIKGSWDWVTRRAGQGDPPKCENTGEGEVWEMLGAEGGDFVSGYAQGFWDEVGGATVAVRRPGYHPGFTFIAMRRIREEKSAKPARPGR